MNERRSSLIFPILILLLLLFLVALTWVNVRYVAQDSGMNAFLTGWASTRSFLTKGWSPYSQPAQDEIQQLAYGRSAQEGEETGAFLYPLYSALIFGPFALIEDFVTARALWMTLLEMAMVGLLWASISLSRWKPSAWVVGILLFFAFFWYPGIRPLLNGDITILCAFFLTLALLAIRSNHDVLAGLLIVFAGIEPRLVLGPLVFLMIWAASQRRWVLFWSPLLNFALLVGVTSLFIPDWAWQNVQQLAGYLKIGMRATPENIITYWLPGVGKQLGRGLILAMAGLMLWEWFQAAGKDFRWFIWTFYLTLVASQLMGLDISLRNYIAFLPALVLVLATWDERWGGLGRALMALSIILLSVGLWAAALQTSQQALSPDLDPVLVFLLPLFLLAGLIWVRWWAIRPPKLYVEILSRHLS